MTRDLGESVLAELRDDVRGQVVGPHDPEYDTARKVHNGMIDKRPAVIVHCTGVADVRTALRWGLDQGLPVAVRSGGHNVAGKAVCDDGIVIDLSRMKGMRVDPVRRVARAQAGLTWGEFDRETQAFGLATTGGAISTTGIAGLTLGGGIGWLQRLHGLACDNLLSADVVTADGRLLIANDDENPDLFWAIRGGGGNFGVVTRLDFRLYPVLPLHNARFDFGWSEIGGAMRIFGDLVRETPDEVRASFSVSSQTGASATCGFFGDPAAAAAYLDTWKASFRRVDAKMSTSMPNPEGEEWATTSVAVDGAFLEGVSDGAVGVLARAAVAGRGFGEILMGLSNGVAARVGMTDTAYPLRGTGLSALLSSEWTRPEDRVRSERWVAEYGAALRPWARRAYVNYIPPSSPERIREIYGVNYPRLARIKARYDPANLFRSNQNIRPRSTS